MANLQGEISLTSDKHCKNGTTNCSADRKVFQMTWNSEIPVRICDGITKASKVWQTRTCCPAKYDDQLSWTSPSSRAIRWRHKSMLSKIHWWMVLRFDSKVHEGCMVHGCVPQIVYRRRLLALSTYHWLILILGLKNTSNVSTWSLVSSVRLKATSITSHVNSLDIDLRQPVAYDSMCYTAWQFGVSKKSLKTLVSRRGIEVW